MNMQTFLRGLLTGITGGSFTSVPPTRRPAAQTPEARARALLLSMLNPKQRRDFERNDSFQFTGSRGTIYELTLGHINNVRWIDSRGQIAGCMCAHPEMYPKLHFSRPLPDEDVVLGQFLSLVTDEREFLSHAVLDWGVLPPAAGLMNKARSRVRRYGDILADFEPWG